MQFITTKYTGESEACPDETTGIGTSHLTNPAKDAGQVIGYSHSTWLSTEKLLAGHRKDDSQVAGYESVEARLLIVFISCIPWFRAVSRFI
jgi:hypothetical protein